ncbi:MAG TPA: hypothetical protein VFA39_01970 [Steroidobacteraceae bacterium]|nr:hypothetical protein [Steroidobacteraceae bacterium]
MTSSRLHMGLLAACAAMAAAVALAQQAPSSSPTTQPAAQSAQKAAADSKAAAPAAAAAAAQKKAADQLIRDARNAGFKPQKVGGNLMFCRTATELGSSFPVRTCYNEDQVRIKIQEYQAQRQQLEGMHSSGMVTN